MSRVSRIALAALVSLVVIIGIYTSVEGASLGASQARIGAYHASMNLDHYRAATQQDLLQMQGDQQQKGHGCDSDFRPSPDD